MGTHVSATESSAIAVGLGAVRVTGSHSVAPRQRTKAERIVDTLGARALGLLPHDCDEQMMRDFDEMQLRYSQLRVSKGFSEADRMARLEFVERAMGG